MDFQLTCDVILVSTGHQPATSRVLKLMQTVALICHFSSMDVMGYGNDEDEGFVGTRGKMKGAQWEEATG